MFKIIKLKILIIVMFSFLNATWPQINLNDVTNKMIDSLIAQAQQSMMSYVESTAKGGANALADSMKNCLSLDSMLANFVPEEFQIDLPCGASFSVEDPLMSVISDVAGMMASSINSWIDQAVDNLMTISVQPLNGILCKEDMGELSWNFDFADKEKDLNEWLKDYSFCGNLKKNRFNNLNDGRSIVANNLSLINAIKDPLSQDGKTGEEIKKIQCKKLEDLKESVKQNIIANSENMKGDDPAAFNWVSYFSDIKLNEEKAFSDWRKTAKIVPGIVITKYSGSGGSGGSSSRSTGGDSGGGSEDSEGSIFIESWESAKKMPTISALIISPLDIYKKLYGYTPKLEEKNLKITKLSSSFKELNREVSLGSSKMKLSDFAFGKGARTAPESSFIDSVNGNIKSVLGTENKMFDFTSSGMLRLNSLLTDSIATQINIGSDMGQFYSTTLYARSQLLSLAIIADIVETRMFKFMSTMRGVTDMDKSLLSLNDDLSNMAISDNVEIQELKNMNLLLNQISIAIKNR